MGPRLAKARILLARASAITYSRAALRGNATRVTYNLCPGVYMDHNPPSLLAVFVLYIPTRSGKINNPSGPYTRQLTARRKNRAEQPKKENSEKIPKRRYTRIHYVSFSPGAETPATLSRRKGRARVQRCVCIQSTAERRHSRVAASSRVERDGRKGDGESGSRL